MTSEGKAYEQGRDSFKSEKKEAKKRKDNVSSSLSFLCVLRVLKGESMINNPVDCVTLTKNR